MKQYLGEGGRGVHLAGQDVLVGGHGIAGVERGNPRHHLVDQHPLRVVVEATQRTVALSTMLSTMGDFVAT